MFCRFITSVHSKMEIPHWFNRETILISLVRINTNLISNIPINPTQIKPCPSTNEALINKFSHSDNMSAVNVLLPCELPSWKSIQNRLWAIQSGKNIFKDRKYVKILAEIREISDFTFANDKKALKSFEELIHVVEKRFNDADRQRFFGQTLPYMARKKKNGGVNGCTESGGLCFSLSKTNETTSLDRRFVASLVANAFFSTFPKREKFLGLMVSNFRFENLFPNIRRSLTDGLRFKNLLNYFSILEAEDAYGFIHFTRQYETAPLSTEKILSSHSVPLCSVFITDSEEIFNLSTNSEVVVRDEKLCLKSSSVLQHPEALAALCFLDKIAPGESLKISGLLSTSSNNDQEDVRDSWDNCRIRLLDTGEDISKNPENLLKELKRYTYCLKEDEEETDIRKIRSESSVRTIDFSSKSSLIDELLAFDENRSTFSERLKAALERGNTPDSLANGTRNRQTKDVISQSTPSSKEDSDGFFHDEQDSIDDDFMSDYSFEYLGEKFDVDADYEGICRNLFNEHVSNNRDERKALLQSLRKSSRRRALTPRRFKRTNSFILDENILSRPSIHLPPDQSQQKNTSEYAKPIWIINPPGSVDPNRFLIQWMSVSLAQVPLVIYQVSEDCESLKTIEKICGVIENRGWGTKELMESLHSYFSDYSLDIFQYIDLLTEK
ncbi:PARG [Lepeophtheirus salmonis]|uniref:PARG n=1 Tax=Lepeophtheirus salmonis TaxID=72036 RepID=A0A7R8CB56_LEPSM|nr:PARG [Lepeophtheirus salmonis]CAF2753156.1 PARG [Lepeophtheirus salmonis]